MGYYEIKKEEINGLKHKRFMLLTELQKINLELERATEEFISVAIGDIRSEIKKHRKNGLSYRDIAVMYGKSYQWAKDTFEGKYNKLETKRKRIT